MKKNQLKNAMALSGAGLQMGLIIYLGYRLGVWLDVKFNKDFFETTLTLAAIFLAVYSLIRQVIKINK